MAAARFLLRKKQPALYRIHEGPADEKLTDLREFLGELGLSLPGGKKTQGSRLCDSARSDQRAGGQASYPDSIAALSLTSTLQFG